MSQEMTIGENTTLVNAGVGVGVDDADADADPVDPAKAGMQIIAKSGDNKFAHLCLYNSLANTDSTATGIEALITIYSNLLALHGFMAGFQYVALDTAVDINEDGSTDTVELIIFSLRYFGFIISLLGTIISLVSQEYLKTMESESIEAQVRGTINYAYFIQLSDYTAMVATFILIVSSNLLLWRNSMPTVLAIIYNAISVFAGLLLLRAFYVVIMKKQPMRLLYVDPDYENAQKLKQERSFRDNISIMIIERFSFMWS